VTTPLAPDCALDIPLQVRSPPKITTRNRPLPVSGNKFNRFDPFGIWLMNDGKQKHITPFSSTIFVPMYFIANRDLKTTLLGRW
jgi:hypothetical protein